VVAFGVAKQLRCVIRGKPHGLHSHGSPPPPPTRRGVDGRGTRVGHDGGAGGDGQFGEGADGGNNACVSVSVSALTVVQQAYQQQENYILIHHFVR